MSHFATLVRRDYIDGRARGRLESRTSTLSTRLDSQRSKPCFYSSENGVISTNISKINLLCLHSLLYIGLHCKFFPIYTNFPSKLEYFIIILGNSSMRSQFCFQSNHLSDCPVKLYR